MKRIAWITLWCVLLVLVLAGIGTAMYATYAMKPTEADGKEVRFTVPSGYGSGRIANILEQNGLIRDARVFRYYLIYKKEGGRFKAGEYAMTPGMELDEIIDTLNAGGTTREEGLRFTIPEGMTVLQIADKLEELPGGFDREAFLAYAENKQEFASVKWASDIPDDARLRHRLEGYLFPETYEMKLESTAPDIVKRMVAELDKKLARLPADWPDMLKQRGLTFHQLLTVASLIEREVVHDEERPLVASVIYNRMKIGMKLQIDATIQYVLDKPKEKLYEKDLLIDSPYNTYKISGLPPGPIASPSLQSIEAALYPQETNYLFYVTKGDGSQKHAFAETYDQHLKNKADSQKR
ncbi:endolytic transglycosylase MltG [Paenibacillus hodogayensis]|uniref:Endolytic murein transglycosylase n=1 Tax=Paenibacillus hodogayensis TaxID=279208 RepID=A0ABV5VVB6_9BACL